MKQIIILFSFLIVSQFAFSQIEGSSVDNSQNTVIAQSGLRMRSAPNLQGEKITTIPFGQEVNILSELSFGKLMKGGKTTTNEEDNLKDDFIGDWVKISYNGQTGYVCNAYLYYSPRDKDLLQDESKRDLNQDIVLLQTGDNCISNIYPQKGRYWYGISFDNNSLKPVIVEYQASYRDVLDYYFLETYAKNENVDFIIGSKNPMTTTQVTNDITNRFSISEEMPEANKAILDKHHLSVKSKIEDNQPLLSLILEKDGKQQILNPNKENTYDHAVNIKWAGDIDGDGQSDFIISYGEEWVQCILYLSSKAEGDQLVKPVAVWYTGYCC